MDSSPESEDKLLLRATITVSLEFTCQGQTKQQRTYELKGLPFCLTFPSFRHPFYICTDWFKVCFPHKDLELVRKSVTCFLPTAENLRICHTLQIEPHHEIAGYKASPGLAFSCCALDSHCKKLSTLTWRRRFLWLETDSLLSHHYPHSGSASTKQNISVNMNLRHRLYTAYDLPLLLFFFYTVFFFSCNYIPCAAVNSQSEIKSPQPQLCPPSFNSLST